MSLGDLLSTACVAVVLATFAGLAVQRRTVTNLREQFGDARAEISDLKEKRAEDKATMTHQASDVEALRRVVTGEVHCQAISDQFDHHHTEAVRRWVRDEELLVGIRDDLRRREA